MLAANLSSEGSFLENKAIIKKNFASGFIPEDKLEKNSLSILKK